MLRTTPHPCLHLPQTFMKARAKASNAPAKSTPGSAPSTKPKRKVSGATGAALQRRVNVTQRHEMERGGGPTGRQCPAAKRVKVEVEPYNGSYDCQICFLSVRRTQQPPAAVLCCTRCTANPWHRACAPAAWVGKCPACSSNELAAWPTSCTSTAASAPPRVGAIVDLTVADSTAAAATAWRPLRGAVMFARALGLGSEAEWREWRA